MPPDCDQFDVSLHYEGSEQITVPFDLAPDERLLITFHGLLYDDLNSPDLSQTTFQGQPPVEVQRRTSAASYLCSIAAGESLCVSGDSLQGPGDVSRDFP